MKNFLFDEALESQLQMQKSLPLPPEEFLDIEKWRAIFYRMGLIGQSKTNHKMFGNISKRWVNTENQDIHFIITGTPTGSKPNLSGREYAKVQNIDLTKKKITAKGLIAPSNQSLIHYQIYQQFPTVRCVAILYHHGIWGIQKKKNLHLLIENDEIGLVPFTGNQILSLSAQGGFLLVMALSVEEMGQMILQAIKLAKSV